MNKNQIRQILQSLVTQQLHANLGGIIGGEEEEEMAERDLKEYNAAVKWFDKNVMSKKSIK